MQTRTHRRTLLARTAASTLTLSATAELWRGRATQAQAAAPAGVTTDAGTISVITQEPAFTSPIWYRPR